MIILFNLSPRCRSAEFSGKHIYNPIWFENGRVIYLNKNVEEKGNGKFYSLDFPAYEGGIIKAIFKGLGGIKKQSES